MRSKWLLIPMAGFALATIGYLWGRTSSDRTEAREAKAATHEGQATAEDPATTANERQVAALQHEVRRLRRANAGLALHARTAAEAGDELEDSQAREEQLGSEDQARQARIEYFDQLSKRVDTEEVDGDWRHHTEAPLKDLLAEHLGREVSLAEVTCASTYCRVKLSHPQSPRLRSGPGFEFDLARASLEVTEVSFDNREEGATTLYFKRGPAPAPQLAEAQAE